ncbi:hypothetical protein Acr_00g0079200 [Actinidia rufa]|uniref:Uncharacterized protein n=1 Tax=Actinidia rufa TaxID=165716 RepID=A0A7J0DTQ2_9ERIC|nr:hypothetical protein Acr_00g0079200 [Actinidia rufa]
MVVAGGEGRTAERETKRGEGFGSSEAAKRGGEPTPPRKAPGIRPSLPRPPAEFEAPPRFGEWGWDCGHWAESRLPVTVWPKGEVFCQEARGVM